ncbi:DUF3164 family protein [Pseudovibrio sp. Tun.PSC04-5.I4]|uniref:DUF3164 family protein n=1 Tax=Pseudovibrio sp. Tun.PSC04-5.I4 TaxID=1798213 RepID=UPI000881EFD8|nr:DUF3164 family protein [Pseudovibrio sp. Tun.PSC04-5.I4]SDR08020.1 Protein of unknown function [Pseudovibrio sp. Tun.PSC04-5.I4]
MRNETLVPQGCWQNAKGAFVPLTTIKMEHQEEDALVKEIVESARFLNQALSKFKVDALGNVQAFRELIAEKYGAKKGGKKGNMTLLSYDGTLAVQVAISEHISFGAELEAAKALIDQCISKWSEGANANLQVLVDDAFDVDKEGKISTTRVLALRRSSIEDADWQRAMDAIADAMRVTGSKTYLRIYERDPMTGLQTPISLDLAAV